MSGWINIDKDMVDDPRLNAAADEHIRDDDTLPLRCKTLDAIVGLVGFCRLLPADWIVELDDGTVKLPGYVEKNRLITKRKRIARNRERQSKWRANQAERNAVSNAVSNSTHNGPVTRYASVTDGDPIPIPTPTLKTLRSSSSGDLSPSSSVRAEPDGLKNREEKKQKVEALVGELADSKRWA